MSTTTTTSREPEILGHYTANRRSRVIYSRRNDAGDTYITDEPRTQPKGKIAKDTYLVEIVPERDGADAVPALVTDYITQANRLRVIPMTHTPITPALPLAQ